MTSFRGTTLRSLYTLLLTLWQIVAGGARIFYWESFTTGLIDLRPLSRAVRLLTLFALALVGGMLLSLLFSEGLRSLGPLEPLVYESDAARGLLAPSLAVPLTLVALTLAWSYVLAGALHVERRVRWLVLIVYLLFGLLSLSTSLIGAPSQEPLQSLALLGCLFVPAVLLLFAAFLLLPRHPLPLPVEFAIMLGLNTLFVAIALFQTTLAQQQFGSTQFSTNLVGELVIGARVLIIPFLFIAGVEMVNFGVEATRWVSRSVQRQREAWIAALLLGAFLLYRLVSLFLAHRDGIDSPQWAAWGGAALLGLGVGLIALWCSRRPEGAPVPYRLVILLIVLMPLVQVMLIPIVSVVSFFFALLAALSPLLGGLDPNGFMGLTNDVLGGFQQLSGAYRELYHLVIALAGAVIALLAYRRQATIAAFGLILAWAQFLFWLMEPGRLLAALRLDYADVDVILLLALAALTLYRAPRRELSERRALPLLALALLGWVLGQTGFLDNPFSPLFAFAGVFFLVFGILWNVLTIGGRFANTGTPAFPRAGRLLLYFGYVLLSLTVAHWYTVTHNVAQQVLQSDFTLRGFTIYGLALAYLVFIEAGKPLLENTAE